MKFDLLEAMAQLKENFGEKAEMLLRNEPHGLLTKITVSHENERHNHCFIISNEEIENTKVDVFEIQIKRSIRALKHRLINA